MQGDAAITEALKNAELDVQALVDADAKGVEGAETRKDLVAAKDKDGRTALHLAAVTGHEDAITALIEAHANTSVKDNEGLTPLAAADKYKQERAVKVLCGLGAHGALIVAARKARADLVKQYLMRNQIVDECDKDDRTALHHAVEQHCDKENTQHRKDQLFEIVKALVKAKANVNHPDSVRLL